MTARESIPWRTRSGVLGAMMAVTVATLAPSSAVGLVVGEWRFIGRTGGMVNLVNVNLQDRPDGLITAWMLGVTVVPEGGLPRGTKTYIRWQYDCVQRRYRTDFVAVFKPLGAPPRPNTAVSDWFSERPDSKAWFDAVCSRVWGESYGDSPDKAVTKALELNPES